MINAVIAVLGIIASILTRIWQAMRTGIWKERAKNANEKLDKANKAKVSSNTLSPDERDRLRKRYERK